jgi:RimJ/RimL family protein N-acetyltransferase
MRGSLVYLDHVRGASDVALLAEWGGGQSSIYSSGRPMHLTPAQVEEILQSSGMDVLMVRTVADDEPIGMMTWRQQTYPGSYTLGVAIGDTEQWGLGLGMEAVILLTGHLFHTLNAHRLHVEVAAYNAGMLPIFTSGMVTVEGVLRDYFFIDGEYHDCVVGSVLRPEYYRIAEQFGGMPDLVSPAEKERARETIDAMLTERGLGGLRRAGVPAGAEPS